MKIRVLTRIMPVVVVAARLLAGPAAYAQVVLLDGVRAAVEALP